MEQEHFKKCSKCGKVMSLDQFHKTSRKYIAMDSLEEYTYEYYRSDCRNCRSKERKKYYQEHGR